MLMNFLFLILASNFVWANKDINEGILKIKSGPKEIRFSGYIDGYYAYDFSNPYHGEKDLELDGGGRDYTSNPLYDRQFSLGYSFFQVEFEHKNIGYRFAYHFGDIVQKMYIEEPERFKSIREATMNIKLNDDLLMEVGLMPSIFGFETFINKDNLHATRSYMTDFAPDFDAGVRFYWKKNQNELLKFQITNGWQVERDKNKTSALGFAYVYDRPKSFHFNWGQFFGDESPSGVKTSYRYYNNLFAKIHINEDWIIAPVLDVGWEQKNHAGKVHKTWAPWQSYGLSARYAIKPQHGIAGRYDRTFDPNGIIPELITNSPNGWDSNGYTLTYEYLFNEMATFRLEGRYVKSKDAVFKTNVAKKFTDEESFIMSQLGLSF
jgi:hypothetical protein